MPFGCERRLTGSTTYMALSDNAHYVNSSGAGSPPQPTQPGRDAGVVPGDPGRMLLSIEVPDVDAVLPTVADRGGTAPGPANDMPWGQRVAHIKDPDGNVVNLTQRI